MKNKQYSNIAPIGPARFVPQVLGGIAGGVGGFLKAKREAEAAGGKVRFKDAWDDVLLGAGKGALNPLSGAAGLATQGLGAVNDAQAMEKAKEAQNVAANAAVDPTAMAVTDPLAIPGNPGAGGMGGIAPGFKKEQNSSYNNNPVFSPSSAGLMKSIYKS
jgi:hypothetical protein